MSGQPVDQKERAMSASHAAQDIIDEFSFFDDWADKYQHLIDQGRRLSSFPEELMDEDHLLKGCQSAVYFTAEHKDGKVHFSACSDAAIVQGLIALLLRVYSGQSASDILATPADFLQQIGLDKHLSPTRKTGLASMVDAIQSAARAAPVSDSSEL